MRAPWALVGLLLLAGCAAPPIDGGPPPPGNVPREPPPLEGSPRELAFETIEGCRARFDYEVTQVLNDRDAWYDFWVPYCFPGQTWEPGGRPQEPRYDFQHRTVVGYFWGAQPSSGYSVRIVRITEHVNETVVQVLRESPGAGCGLLGTITHPFHLVVAEKSWKPFRFQVEDRTEHCEGGEEGDVRAGAWLFRFPANVTGHLGEAVNFTVEAIPSPGSDRSILRPEPWLEINGTGNSLHLPPEGGAFRARVLVGAVPQVRFFLHEDERGWPVPGPPVTVRSRPGAEPLGIVVHLESLDDPAEALAGATARAEQDVVTATYSMGTFREVDCDESAAPQAEWGVWNVSGKLRLVGFVRTVQSDACTGGPFGVQPKTPRVVGTASPLPAGDLEVVVYEFRSCFCVYPQGWSEHRASVHVPGRAP